MSVTDDQLELLEAYIDGELAEAQAVALQTQLHANSELTAALQSLREQRQTRVQISRLDGVGLVNTFGLQVEVIPNVVPPSKRGVAGMGGVGSSLLGSR